MDFLGISEQDTAGNISLRAERRRPNRPRLIALGKDDSFLRRSGTLGDPIAKCRRRHARFDGNRGTGSDPIRIDVKGDVIHPELNAFDIVLRHLRIHLMEVGGRFPAVRFDSDHGQASFQAGCTEIPDALIQVKPSREHQPGDGSLQGRQGNGHDHVAAINWRHQNRPCLESMEHVGNGARQHRNFLHPASLNFALVQHLTAQVTGDIDSATGRQFRILRDGSDKMETAALQQSAFRRERVSKSSQRQLLRVRHMIDDAADDRAGIQPAILSGSDFQPFVKFFDG